MPSSSFLVFALQDAQVVVSHFLPDALGRALLGRGSTGDVELVLEAVGAELGDGHAGLHFEHGRVL